MVRLHPGLPVLGVCVSASVFWPVNSMAECLPYMQEAPGSSPGRATKFDCVNCCWMCSSTDRAPRRVGILVRIQSGEGVQQSVQLIARVMAIRTAMGLIVKEPRRSNQPFLLWPSSSMVERFRDMEEASGSIPEMATRFL